MLFRLRPSSASESARHKVAVTAALAQQKIEEGSVAAAPFEPEDGCVVEGEDVVVCGAPHACRLIAGSALRCADPVVDDWIEWSETIFAPAVAALVASFEGSPVRALPPSRPVVERDEFSFLLGAFTPPPNGVPAAAKAAISKTWPLMAALEGFLATDNSDPTLAHALLGVDAVYALPAWAPGSFPRVEALVARLPSVDLRPASLERGTDESPTKFVTRLFAAAIARAFPQLEWPDPAVMRCANDKFGDYQCNAPMSIFKALKGAAKSPRAVGEAIVASIPANQFVASTSVAPAGFVNTVLRSEILSAFAVSVARSGAVPAPPLSAFGGKRQVLVDFSSPNVAKEMHVGHLRSTIIGDTVCRVLEYCGHEVRRVNHLGDWGTQFGMLITHLETAYPDFTENPPNITDLTTFYKDAKKRFDADPEFKDKSRARVVTLQAGDPRSLEIWRLLCDLSRKEFDKVYERLDVALNEYGESYYNDMIPGTIEELERKGLVSDENGAACIHLPNHGFPLIVRKSDGGYGYDSTDAAAVRHRLIDLGCDWLVYITDVGQQEHFHMVFEMARAAGWTRDDVRLRHVGFGVVQGLDGKRFRTRSSETTRLVDLLDEAVVRMEASLVDRVKDGKCSLSDDKVKEAAAVVGYGAVKYFDLHQHPATNYKFSYDKMLSTSGNTAVYLLYSHARLASIIRKSGLDVPTLVVQDLVHHPKERQLAFELSLFVDVVEAVANDYLPNRLCDYLYRLSTKFTDFVTDCKVLGDPRQSERLVLCEATGVVMRQAFTLLGIKYLMQI
ncbi:hypothetical protein CTAYLR_004218 [Chrysophaeum taylorii]|uniref:arginine--tRNA ligase n=1 Tax=Chrysophaeum taylorii TaxID=2483200 RepID=A0AAD7XNI8_9STRA|nr:hypothetical protein CTAYLR_004218 [Chrysophaeum taylorii]